jgi:hypothetical protein
MCFRKSSSNDFNDESNSAEGVVSTQARLCLDAMNPPGDPSVVSSAQQLLQAPDTRPLEHLRAT